MKWLNKVKSVSKLNSATLFFIWLVLANAGYMFHDFAGWTLTLSYLLLAPGLLILYLFKIPKLHTVDKLSLSIGLSLLFLMTSGLIVNSLGVFGVARPLSTLNLFSMVDIFSCLLILLNAHNFQKETHRTFRLQLTAKELSIIGVDIILIALAILGAIRLNNGGSDILTMILFGLIPVVLFLLLLSKQLGRVRLLTLFSIALAILLTTSLRGWHITGHDIQQEYMVFQLTFSNQHWNIAALRSPYNACLSITILPTIIAKLTAIHSVYIFKVVFQILFALITVPIYRLLQILGKNFRNDSLALIGTFMFMSFITFFNDMPFLNRQEIAFIFFVLILYVNFSPNLARKAKHGLTILMMIGLVFSHYSTSYILLALLLIASLFYKLLLIILKKNKRLIKTEILAMFNYRIILIALLATFLWNAQVTSTSKGLVATVKSTLSSAIDDTGTKSPDVSNALFSSSQVDSTQLLKTYAGDNQVSTHEIKLTSGPISPFTSLGSYLNNHLPQAISINSSAKNLGSKLIQILAIVGTIIMLYGLFKNESSASSVYFVALSFSAIILLVAISVLPQLSLAYGALRIFQQMIPILCVPVIIGFTTIFAFSKKYKNVILAAFFIFLFYDSSGFIPQLIGGYPPQLSLNNAGQYYQAYYIHESEIASASWAESNLSFPTTIAMDDFAQIRFTNYIAENKIHAEPLVSTTPKSYIYEDAANVSTGLYEINFNGSVLWYRLASNITQPIIYTNGGSNIYGK